MNEENKFEIVLKEGEYIPSAEISNKFDVSLVVDKPIPSTIDAKNFKPQGDNKGLRYKSIFLEYPYQQQQMRQVFYTLWRRHPWVRAMVDKVADIASSIGFVIKYEGKETPDPKKKDMITNFFEYPNYKESWEDICWVTVAQLLIFGESFWEVVRNNRNEPIDFYILNGSVTPIVDDCGNPIPGQPDYIQTVMGNEVKFEFDEVIWFKRSDVLGRLRPSPPMEALELTLLVDIYVQNLNKRLLTKGVRKGKVFIFPSDTGEETMKRNREQLRLLHEGIEGSYSAFAALEGECKVQDLELAETKMEGKDLREFLRDEIAAVFGVPIAKLGIMNTETKESEFINRTFYEEKIVPTLTLIEDTINRFLDLMEVYDYRFRFKKKPAIDTKDLARMIDVLKKHGAISINEVRDLIGLDAIQGEGTNIPFLQLKDSSIVYSPNIKEERVSPIIPQGSKSLSRKGIEFPAVQEVAANNPFRGNRKDAE